MGDQAVAGVGAGLAAAAIACPTELIKCRLQAQAGARLSPASPAPVSLAVSLPGTAPGAVQLINLPVKFYSIFAPLRLLCHESHELLMSVLNS